MYDILIKNARLIDGSGAPAFRGSLAVSDGRIAAIGEPDDQPAAAVIDAKDHILCPGFIDAHGHSDFTLFVNHRGESKIRQGITTEVTGNCGFTAGPITEDHRDDLIYYLANTIVLNDERRELWRWKTQNEFLEYSARNGLSFNIVPLVGQGMIHVGVMGFEDRDPTEEELQRMKDMLQAELDKGFFGMSMAYAYEPAENVRAAETAALCGLLRERDCIYTVHMANECNLLTESVQETIGYARASGVRVEISHLKANYRSNWGKSRDAIRLIEDARAEGLDVAFDVYPYTAYGSGLIDLIPHWVKKDGPRIMCQRLRDPALRRRALDDMERGIEGWDNIMRSEGWEHCVQLASLRTEEGKRLEGLTIGQVAEQRGCTPYEVVTDLMVEEDASVKCVWFAINEDELISIMKHPIAIFGTDGRACATYGELSAGAVHPRYYGTYPRIMGHYVRELGIFPLEEAIRKATSAPAEKFRIPDRGLLREGYFADLVLFDPDTIRDVGKFGDPHHYPEGIDYVIVNGQIVIDHGVHTGTLPGKILRKA